MLAKFLLITISLNKKQNVNTRTMAFFKTPQNYKTHNSNFGLSFYTYKCVLQYSSSKLFFILLRADPDSSSFCLRSSGTVPK